jgi:hypothetical protein
MSEDGDGWIVTLVSTIAVIFLGYRGYEYYDDNSASAFARDLTEGILDTLAAGYSHPAFGFCCLMPIFLSVVLVSFLDRESGSDTQSNDDE